MGKLLEILELAKGIEPPTCGLQNLNQLDLPFDKFPLQERKSID